MILSGEHNCNLPLHPMIGNLATSFQVQGSNTRQSKHQLHLMAEHRFKLLYKNVWQMRLAQQPEGARIVLNLSELDTAIVVLAAPHGFSYRKMEHVCKNELGTKPFISRDSQSPLSR